MKCVGTAFTCVVVVLVSANEVRATTLHVANTGVDSATCGPQAAPCRSIGQAITNSSAGDTVVVGPGVYGDLTDNGDFLTPGEEPGGPACGRGVICIDKPLIIESSHGAPATLYKDGGGVQVLADGVVFGGAGKGFTLAGRSGNNIYVAPGTTGSTVRGNVLSRQSAIYLAGTGHVVDGNAAFSDSDGGCCLVNVQGSGHSVTSNVILAQGSGIEVAGTDIVIQGNSIFGNIVGIFVSDATNVRINGNNIVANGQNSSDFVVNCGIYNTSGMTIDATNNFWGAASGPGPDPADEVCDAPSSTTTVSPFATQQFPIASPGGGGGGGNGSPVCTAAQAVPSMLWPANGQFIRVWIIGIGDPDDDPVAVSVSGVTQDEPTTGMVTGDSGPDAVLFGSSVDLRAQRDAGGNGRTYRVQFEANDGNGGSCTGAVTVGVPNSQKPGQAIVDDGQNFDSTQP